MDARQRQLEHRSRIEKYLAKGIGVGGGTNSTTMITDMNTVLANISTTQQNRGAGGSPVATPPVIVDVTAMCGSILLRLQEMKVILNYLLYGNMAGTGVQQTAGGIFLTGDSNNSNTGAKLVGIYTNLS